MSADRTAASASSPSRIRPASTAARFVARLIAVSPRAAMEAGLVALAVTASEGVGLLLLVPLLQLVGVQTEQGPIARVAGLVSNVLSSAGLRPTLGMVL